MAQQVSGSDKALLVAIRDGDVPRPPLVDWNNWQIWRRDYGRRPTSSVDGFTTSSTLETNIWRAVMAELYGEHWTDYLLRGEDPPSVAAPLPQQLREPSLGPATSAGEPHTPARRPASVADPGSGELPTGAAAPGAGIASPVPSWNSQDPGTPGTLNRMILADYDPEKEVLERYQSRVRRQAAALIALDAPLEEGLLEIKIAKSAFIFRLYEEARGDPPRQLRVLKRLYVMEQTELDGSPAQRARITALDEMLEQFIKSCDASSLSWTAIELGLLHDVESLEDS